MRYDTHGSRWVTVSQPPEPIVVRYVLGKFKTRQGRGFSEAELKEAGISISQARRLLIRVDPRRRSKIDENVRALKAWLENLSKHSPDRNQRELGEAT